MSHVLLVQDTWSGCYLDGWQGICIPDAFQHPAKFARSLIQRLYQHARAEGWISPGDWILDPFSGVSLGAHDALLAGYNVLHCELEPRFHALAQQNVALWQQRYGHLPGYGQAVLLQGDSRQLCALVQGQGQVGCVVSSPPFSDSIGASAGIDKVGRAILANLLGKTQEQVSPIDKGNKATQASYGTTSGQLGNDNPTTFWEAASQVVSQTYALLAPGGHALWVTKHYVRDGRLVDFPGDWRRLCEAVGFVTLHEHHALLTEHHGTQGGLFGEDTEHTTTRKSFFRRLAERNGSPSIDFETVWCMVKPATVADGNVACCISSPPYAQAVHGGNGIDQAKLTGNRPGRHSQATMGGYGQTDGQLASMPPGALACVVSSPPYAGAGEVLGSHNGIDYSKITNGGTTRTPARAASGNGYGQMPGQLGSMPAGHVALVISSPPYGGNEKADYRLSPDGKTRRRDVRRGYRQGYGCFRGSETYGQTDGQLGTMPEGDTP